MSTKEKMRNEVMWKIRDNHTLPFAEKSFLWAVESRGVAHGTWRTVSKDAGMSKGTFYKTRDALVQKGMLSVLERPGTTTEYRVIAEGLHTPYEGSSPVDEAEGLHTPYEGGFTTGVKGVSYLLSTEEDLKEDTQVDQPSAPEITEGSVNPFVEVTCSPDSPEKPENLTGLRKDIFRKYGDEGVRVYDDHGLQAFQKWGKDGITPTPLPVKAKPFKVSTSSPVAEPVPPAVDVEDFSRSESDSLTRKQLADKRGHERMLRDEDQDPSGNGLPPESKPARERIRSRS